MFSIVFYWDEIAKLSTALMCINHRYYKTVEVTNDNHEQVKCRHFLTTFREQKRKVETGERAQRG